jgi:hypothetical protein
MQHGEKLASLGRKMSKFDVTGHPRKDPLVELHKYHGVGLSPQERARKTGKLPMSASKSVINNNDYD